MAFGAPDTPDRFQVAEHEGSLALVLVHQLVLQVPTAYGVKDGVRCEVALIDGPTAGQRYPDAMIFNSKLVPQLRGKAGSPEAALGRIIKGQQAKAGQSPPFILAEPTAEDIAKAQAWEQTNGELKLPAPGQQQQQQEWPPQQQPNGNHQPPPNPYPNQGQQPAYAGQPATSYTQQPPF